MKALKWTALKLTHDVFFLFSRQQSLLGSEPLSTPFLKEVSFGPLYISSNPCIPVCTFDF